MGECIAIWQFFFTNISGVSSYGEDPFFVSLVVRFHWKISTQVQGESTVEPFIERDCDIAEFLDPKIGEESAGDGGNCGFKGWILL